MSKVPSVESRPYIVLKPYGKPEYRASFKSARDKLLSDLKQIQQPFLALNIQDALRAIEAVKDEVECIPESGGKVDGVIDPFSGVRYRAEIVRRQCV